HHDLQRIAPRGFAPLAVFTTNHRVSQAVFGIEAVIREAIAVADPAFIDVVVFERHHAFHAIELDLRNQVGAQAVVRAHGTATGQFPRPRTHLVRLGKQRTDRAEIDHVARKLGLDRLAQESGDLGELAPVHHANFHDAADLFTEADATRAVNATLHAVGGDERAHVLGRYDALGFLITRSGLAVTHGQILQLAFAALVTDRAVERVIDEQELHDRVLGGNGLFRTRLHDHAV